MTSEYNTADERSYSYFKQKFDTDKGIITINSNFKRYSTREVLEVTADVENIDKEKETVVIKLLYRRSKINYQYQKNNIKNAKNIIIDELYYRVFNYLNSDEFNECDELKTVILKLDDFITDIVKTKAGFKQVKRICG